MTEADYALLGIDAVTIAYVWAWGFGSVVTMYFTGYAVGVAKRVIGMA